MPRGRTSIPTNLKVMRGNPGKRGLNKREPKPTAADPACPEHLDPVAKQEWDRLLPILRTMRVLTEADGILLANLCSALATQFQAQETLKMTGLVVRRGTTESPWFQISPLQGLVNEQMQIVKALCAEFGLSPAARTRVQTVSDHPNVGSENGRWGLILKK